MTRLLLRAAVLAALLTASSVFAFADNAPTPAVIPKAELLTTVSRELIELREQINAMPHESGPEREIQQKALKLVNRTQAEFEKRIGGVMNKTNYAIEARYLGDAFYFLVIKPTSDAVSVIANPNSSARMRSAAVTQLTVPSAPAVMAKREEDFRKEFYAENKDEINAVVKLRWQEQNGKFPGRMPRRSDGAADAGAGDDGYADRRMGQFLRRSPLIQLGTISYEIATGSSDGGNNSTPNTGTGNPVDPTNPSNPSGGTGGAEPNGPQPDESGGGRDETSWAGMANGSFMNIPQTMTDGAAQALQNGDYAQAASLAQVSLQFDPKNKDALGILYSVKGRSEGEAAGSSAMGAAAAFDRAGSDPGGLSGPSGVESFGAASASLGAAGSFVSPGSRIAAGNQARADAMNAMRLGDAESALAILSKALKQDPNNPALLNMRSQVYGKLGRWEEALKDADAGLALVPGGRNLALLNSKATAENRTHRYREALATSNLMIATDPRNAWGYAQRAHAAGGLGDREAMLADINHAAQIDPNFRQAAAAAALLQLPLDSDVLFLFPGESGKKRGDKAPAAEGRGKSFSLVVGGGLAAGLLLALGLLSSVLGSLKKGAGSAFTRVSGTGPAAAPVAAAPASAPASAPMTVGGLIRGQYAIVRQIGAGGMGMVYEGTDKSLGRRVAIKKMRDELRVNARERDRFIIEAKTVASLHHPGIVDIYAIAEEGEDVYLVFEYVDGKTVHELVQLKGRLDVAESVRVTRAMGEALTYAHAHNVIHRDMKPSNVMVTGAGEVKVMDFGIARMAKDALTRYSMTNTVVGTPPYMAPEQEQGVVRKESDVYALAICAYEMLTGKLPFIGMGAGMLMNKINMSYIPPSRNIAGLPESLDAVFLKAFQADPEQRYRTPKEFVAALETAASGARSKAGG